MADERASLSIRMPPSLLERLKAAASDRSHSMNAEIIQRLEESFEPRSLSEVVMNLPGNVVNSDRRYLEGRIQNLEEQLEETKRRIAAAQFTQAAPHVIPIAEFEQRQLERELTDLRLRLAALTPSES